MKTNITLRLASIVVLLGALTVGATGAFFSDTEVSSGNSFTAESIDLTVDSHAYYNGVYQDNLSWAQKDLETGDLFFSFDDVKHGDWGEDTISLHVEDNDWWMCVDALVTSSLDASSTESELEDEVPYTPNEGELDEELFFIFWADDGDNVLENLEWVIYNGSVASSTGLSALVAWADSSANHWTSGVNHSYSGNAPMLAGDTYYIGVGWCLGEMLWAPLSQDGVSDGSINNPTVNPGFSCDGGALDNSTQTDSLTVEMSFRAEQARHNEDYLCPSYMPH